MLHSGFYHTFIQYEQLDETSLYFSQWPSWQVRMRGCLHRSNRLNHPHIHRVSALPGVGAEPGRDGGSRRGDHAPCIANWLGCLHAALGQIHGLRRDVTEARAWNRLPVCAQVCFFIRHSLVSALLRRSSRLWFHKLHRLFQVSGHLKRPGSSEQEWKCLQNFSFPLYDLYYHSNHYTIMFTKAAFICKNNTIVNYYYNWKQYFYLNTF